MRSKLSSFIIMMTLLFLLPSGCRKDEGEIVAYATNISDISALQQQTESRLATPCENGKKIEILWNTRKIVNGNVYAEFLVDKKKIALSDGNKNFSKYAGAYFFADKPNNVKYTYLVFINPDSTFVMDYKKLDLFNFNKIKFTGYVHYYDLCMNFEHSNYYKDGKLIRYKNKKDANTGAKPPKASGSRCACDPCYWYECGFFNNWAPGLYQYNVPGPYYGMYVDFSSCWPLYFDPCLPECIWNEGCTFYNTNTGGGTSNGGNNTPVDCSNPINAGHPNCGTVEDLSINSGSTDFYHPLGETYSGTPSYEEFYVATDTRTTYLIGYNRNTGTSTNCFGTQNIGPGANEASIILNMSNPTPQKFSPELVEALGTYEQSVLWQGYYNVSFTEEWGGAVGPVQVGAVIHFPRVVNYRDFVTFY